VSEAVPDGSDTAEITVETPMKYKHCCGDIDNQRKAMKVRRFMQQHFGAILGTPRRQGKLSMIANKIKSLFKFGSKK
jgi:hypothetical protein